MNPNQAPTGVNDAAYLQYDLNEDDFSGDFDLNALSNPFATTSFEPWATGEHSNAPLLTTVTSNQFSTCLPQSRATPIPIDIRPFLTELSILRTKVDALESMSKTYVKGLTGCISMLIQWQIRKQQRRAW